jgi:hypothetical protein
VYPLGGPGEVQLGGHGDEVLQVAKFHVTILSRFAIIGFFFFRWTRSLVRVLARQCPVDDHYF